jgi:hypothetical protein
MTAYSINLPFDVQTQITSFAMQYSVDALVASAVAQVSSSGQQFNSDGSLVVTPFGVGVMGIGKNVAAVLGLDATTQLGNIQAGVATLAALLQAFVGKYPLALAAYVTSVGTVRQFNGIPPIAPVADFVYNVSKIAALAGSTSVSALYTIRSESSLDPTPPSSITGDLVDPATTGVNYGVGTNSRQNLTDLSSSIQPVLQVPDNSLSNTPWYKDHGLVTGNKSIRNTVQPVTFTVYFDRNDPNTPSKRLQNPSTGQIIEIQLNTSMTTFEIASKHVYNRTPSRTGMHITLWGMEPDLISGAGTTGVFMNQFGITDFMSVAGINDDIKKLLTSGFTSPKFLKNASTEQQATGAVLFGPTQQTSTADQIISSQQLNNPSEAFRVAAQDAFVEFLKLFQMNANVWYHDDSYANGTNLGLIGGTQQVAPTAWSPSTGTTSFQQHARNNDVMTRGYVSMRYRNNIYLGYFKSLSWTQDAESPFQWKFNFVFQVEKTYTALYFSQPSVAQPTGTSVQNFQSQNAIEQGDGAEES